MGGERDVGVCQKIRRIEVSGQHKERERKRERERGFLSICHRCSYSSMMDTSTDRDGNWLIYWNLFNELARHWVKGEDVLPLFFSRVEYPHNVPNNLIRFCTEGWRGFKCVDGSDRCLYRIRFWCEDSFCWTDQVELSRHLETRWLGVGPSVQFLD